MEKRKIRGGLYLVVDPSMAQPLLQDKLTAAIEGGVSVVQIWNNWEANIDKQAVVNAVCSVAHARNIPVLINDDWELLQTTELDGVHFDVIPNELKYIRQNIARPIFVGITCGNDLSRIEWANKNDCDYVSFCSMFPSVSAGACEIVTKDTVQHARAMTTLPIFLAGGITLHNLQELANTGLDGVALISAIMHSNDPQKAAQNFLAQLKTINKNESIINK